MLSHIKLQNLLFIDIETVPTHQSYSLLSDTMQELWLNKHNQLKIADETAEEGYLKRAGVYSEFAKVICICIGYLHTEKDTERQTLRIKSFANDNETLLLHEFSSLIRNSFDNPERFSFCGHNIREFDIPFLSRRMLVNGINLPEMFDNSGKRPWQINDVDTLQLWKFGDYKSYISLRLLSEILQIPSSKNDIEGKDVCRIYWQEKDLKRIATYCQRDVVTTFRIMQKFKGETTIIPDTNVVFV